MPAPYHRTQGQYLGNNERVGASMHGTFSELWREVAGDEVHSATTFCNEYRSLEACVAPFADHDPASGVGSSLALESAAIGVINCPYQDEWRRGDVTDPKAQAKVRMRQTTPLVCTTGCRSSARGVAAAAPCN
jgi:hypothetical protein